MGISLVLSFPRIQLYLRPAFYPYAGGISINIENMKHYKSIRFVIDDLNHFNMHLFNGCDRYCRLYVLQNECIERVGNW